jgi:hypothetical protein
MDNITYLDFEVLIQRFEVGRYRANVKSPVGEASAVFNMPLSELETKNFVLEVKNYLLRRNTDSRQSTRRIDSPEIKAAKSIGGTLFNTVFNEELKMCLRSSLDEARRQSTGLRIRLRMTDVPELADLPWEYLYNESLNRFLTLSEETPLVRYLDQPEPVTPIAVTPPLRVLVMISSPNDLAEKDLAELDVEGEWAKLRESLSDLEQRGLVSLEKLEKPTLPSLLRQLRRGKYHIFHFIGHGGFDLETQDGLLVLEDEQKHGKLITGQELGTLLHNHQTLRLVVLNACEGARGARNDPFAGLAQSLIQQKIPAVIAMQFEITDGAAKTFAYDFYGAVAEGYSLERAVAQARLAIYAEGNALEWGTPVLYLRAPDGLIFKVDQAATVNDADTTEAEDEECLPIAAPSNKTESPASPTLAAPTLDKGIMDPNSPFYIERVTDKDALEIIQNKQGEVIIIKGSGQMGKSSVLRRILVAAREVGKLVTYIDFQRIGKDALTDGSVFFRRFSASLAVQLEKADQLPEYDKIPLGDTDRCTQFVSRYLLKKTDKPIVLAMDEVDSFFDANFRSDFFAMLRSWYHEGAIFPVWKQLDMVFVTSAEPFQLINDQGSPFNVGTLINLMDLTPAEVSVLNLRYGSPLSFAQEQELMKKVGGHPFLVRLALYLVCKKSQTIGELLSIATSDNGPFGEHLQSLRARINDREELVSGLREVLVANTCKQEAVLLRLAGLGVVRRERRKVTMRCQLYEDYFKEQFHV